MINEKSSFQLYGYSLSFVWWYLQFDALSWYTIFYRWRLSCFSQPKNLSKGWSLLDKAKLSKRRGSCQKSHDASQVSCKILKICNLPQSFEMNPSKCTRRTRICVSKPNYKVFNEKAPPHLCFYSTSDIPNFGASASSTNAPTFCSSLSVATSVRGDFWT